MHVDVNGTRLWFDALPDGSARLEVIEGAGHFTWRDAPDRYWPIVLDFLATYSSSGSGSTSQTGTS